jgi:aspartate racemase
MKTIGLLGGVSWHSTLEYYRLINEFTNKKLGGIHAAKMLVYSFNFHEIRTIQAHSEKELSKRLILEAEKLEDSGADCLLIGANTMHMFYDDIQEKLKIPVIHIAVETGKIIKAQSIKKVGLLATKYTMELDFYANKLKQQGIEVVVPDEADRKIVSDIIYNELVKGEILEKSKKQYVQITEKLIKQHEIEGLILGCTEIPLLIQQNDLSIPVFNTTEIHAKAAVEFATS